MKPVQYFTAELTRIRTYAGSIRIPATSAEDAREQAEALADEDSPEIIWEDSPYDEVLQVEGVIHS